MSTPPVSVAWAGDSTTSPSPPDAGWGDSVIAEGLDGTAAFGSQAQESRSGAVNLPDDLEFRRDGRSPLQDWAGATDIHGADVVDDVAAAGAGQAISQARRDATVQVIMSGGFVCSGTLITPRLVVTAGHCVEGTNGLPTTVLFGHETAAARPTRQVLGCYMHNSYADLEAGAPSPPPDTEFTPVFERCAVSLQRALKRTRHDMAVMILDERVEMDRAGNIDVIPARANFTVIPAGTTLRVAGFGSADGPTRRTRTANLTGYWDSTNINLQGSAVFPDMVVHGDSGGPMFLGDAESTVLEWVGDCADWSWNWGGPAVDGQVVYAPASHSGNADFVRQFLEESVDLPPVIQIPVWAGDWDPVGGPQDRDSDGLAGAHDNCPSIRNPEQRDGSTARPGSGRPSSVDVALDGVADFSDCLGPVLLGSGVL